MTLWVGSPHPKSPTARFGVHSPYGTGVGCISSNSNSNSNSNADVPIPRFTNGLLEVIKKQVSLKSYSPKIRTDLVNQILKNKES